jgi:hypothetical protein
MKDKINERIRLAMDEVGTDKDPKSWMQLI